MRDTENMNEEDRNHPMHTAACPPTTLADLRRQAGVTQAQIAQHMGVTQSRVSHLEARYPNVRYEKLVAYMTALGADLRFVGPNGINIAATDVHADPHRVVDALDRASASGVQRLNPTPAPSAEELPLQGNQPEPGGDEPGREVDEADADNDAGDSSQGQEP